MRKLLRFIRLSERWFVDIPWSGSVDDLQMVSGADLFLDSICNGDDIVSVIVNTEDEEPNSVKLTKVNEDEFGAFYKVNTYEYKGEIWLCTVTVHIFGEFPEHFYFNVLKKEKK